MGSYNKQETSSTSWRTMMVGGEELEQMASDPEMKLVAKEPAKEIARPTDGGPR